MIYNSIYLLILILVCHLISPSLAKKRAIDEPELSLQASKLQKIEYHNIDRQQALDLIAEFKYKKIDCTPEALNDYKELFQRNDLAINNYINDCDNQQAKKWVDTKIFSLGDFGEVIQRWLRSIHHSVAENHGQNFYFLLQADLRDDYTYSKRLKNAGYEHRGKHLDEEAYYNVNYAYYSGDGICVFMLSPPFDRVERFIDAVMRDYTVFNSWENRLASSTLEIYVYQKVCRKFYESPRPSKNNSYNLGYIDTSQISLDIFETKEDQKTCEMDAVLKFKMQYRTLDTFFSTARNFKERKMAVDQSLDSLVEFCLSTILAPPNQVKYIVDQIYEKVKDPDGKKLIQEMANRLKKTIELCDLPDDQSVNSLLDIWLPSSCRELVINNITQVFMFNPNLELVGLFADLLLGHIGHVSRGIFREPIFNKKYEYKFVKFLFQVFSIKGYKPSQEIESPLLDFYYLYKIAEITAMIPINNIGLIGMNKPIKPVSKVMIDLQRR